MLIAALAVPGIASAQTLDQAIADALAHAPEIAAADAGVEAATARIDQARAAQSVTTDLQATIGAGHIDMHGFFGMGTSSVVPRAAQVTVEKPLFTGGRISEAMAQARAGKDISVAAQSESRAQLIRAVTEAYTGVQLADRQIALMNESVTTTRRLVHDAQLLFRSGAGSRTDVAQANARLAEAQAGLAQAEGNAASARARYRAVTGSMPQQLTSVTMSRALPATLSEALDRADASNASLVQARASVAAAEARTRASRAEARPMVSAFAEGAVVRDQFFPNYSADTATIGVRARWRLLDGGMTRAKVAESSAQERAASAQLRATELSVEQNVTAAWHAVRTAEAVIIATAAQKAAADDALRNARLEFQIGTKPQLAVLDAQREATAAGLSQAQAAGQLLLAQTRLLTLIGGY